MVVESWRDDGDFNKPVKGTLASAHAWEGVIVKLGLFTDASEARNVRRRR